MKKLRYETCLKAAFFVVQSFFADRDGLGFSRCSSSVNLNLESSLCANYPTPTILQSFAATGKINLEPEENRIESGDFLR